MERMFQHTHGEPSRVITSTYQGSGRYSYEEIFELETAVAQPLQRSPTHKELAKVQDPQPPRVAGDEMLEQRIEGRRRAARLVLANETQEFQWRVRNGSSHPLV